MLVELSDFIMKHKHSYFVGEGGPHALWRVLFGQQGQDVVLYLLTQDDRTIHTHDDIVKWMSCFYFDMTRIDRMGVTHCLDSSFTYGIDLTEKGGDE